MWSGRQERSVKPSAQPTLVRTQHLPPPAKTVRMLWKRGPAGRSLLVAVCIRVGHRGSMHGSGYGHIADSVRAERAVRITARFADLRPFCPVTRAPKLFVWVVMRCTYGRFFAILPAPGGGLVLFLPAAGAGCRIRQRHTIEAAAGGGDRVRVTAAGMGRSARAVASVAVPGSGRHASGGVMPQGFPVSPVRDCCSADICRVFTLPGLGDVPDQRQVEMAGRSRHRAEADFDRERGSVFAQPDQR